MTGLTRLRALGFVGLMALCLALPASGLGAAKPKYTVESQQVYESQLGKGEIASAIINKPVRSVRIVLKDGSLVLYHYPKEGAPAVEAALRAKGIPVSELKGTHKKHPKPPTHTRRYIAIGLVVVLVLAGAAFLLWRRGRSSRD